jgi:diguanylate cyclase (GGDEF)-like protein
VLALALTGTLIVLAWVVALKKRVKQQTILLRESEERFRHMALHDGLTGLATRVLLQDRLITAVDTANRHKTGLALLLVDLDKFKDINDTFGHQAGDEVLRVTADRLIDAVRKIDTVARIGGDEFVVLLTDLRDPHIAERIAASIVKNLAVPVSFEGGELPVTTSAGVCMFKGADAALYQAKASGRNCYRVYTPEMARGETQNAN